MMKIILIILSISCSFFMCACTENHTVTAPPTEAVIDTGALHESLHPAAKDALAFPINKQVYLYCKIVQQAVEEYAAANRGFYPSDVGCDVNSCGDTVTDLLPGGRPMENIFTGACTEPIDGASAQPGEIGYMVCIHKGKSTGYVVTGSGKNARCIVTIYKDPATGEITDNVGR